MLLSGLLPGFQVSSSEGYSIRKTSKEVYLVWGSEDIVCGPLPIREHVNQRLIDALFSHKADLLVKGLELQRLVEGGRKGS